MGGVKFGFFSLCQLELCYFLKRGRNRHSLTPCKTCFKSEKCFLFSKNKRIRYTGPINYTKSGKTCQHWNSDGVHNTNKELLLRSGNGVTWRNRGSRQLKLARHNKCRNPDSGRGRGYGPWCYTTDESIRWEYCDIPVCESKNHPTNEPEQAKPTEKTTQKTATTERATTTQRLTPTVPEPTCGITCGCGEVIQPWLSKTSDTPCSFTETCGITNGEFTSSGEYPWQVVIYRTSYLTGTVKQACGGSILNRKTVISAAHCYSGGIREVDLTVGVGFSKAFPENANNVTRNVSVTLRDIRKISDFEVYDLGKMSDFGAGLHEVEQIKTTQTFNTKLNFGDDIALLILKTDINYPINTDVGRTMVRPICLPSKKSIKHLVTNDNYPKHKPDATRCVITGFGGHVNNNLTIHDYSNAISATHPLRQASVNIISMENCEEKWKDVLGTKFNSLSKYPEQISQTSICAGDSTDLLVDTCGGDSGGPLVCENVELLNDLVILENGVEKIVKDVVKTQMVLFGLTSWGSQKCGVGYPAVYTKVTEFLDWISENAEGDVQFV